MFRISGAVKAMAVLAAIASTSATAYASHASHKLLPNLWSDSNPARHWYCYNSDNCYFFPDYVERSVADESYPYNGELVVDLTQGGWTATGYCTWETYDYFVNDDSFNSEGGCYGGAALEAAK
jgi:hypothetical protein